MGEDMSDLQAKYNALLMKFIGDGILVNDNDAGMEVAKDIAAAMREKAKRNYEISFIKSLKDINFNDRPDIQNFDIDHQYYAATKRNQELSK
jgi:hypothetical protein